MLHLIFHYTLLLKHMCDHPGTSQTFLTKKSEINNFLIKQFCSNLLHVVPQSWDEYAGQDEWQGLCGSIYGSF